ncbi:DUF2705 family protein [Sporolactobacillus sp. THM19-2]|uniref:DUF2705 family protein n=1 Tax=Sporolactobacillus sp. THM19-2 TaxID=2511171 RepID=UPI001021B7FE|nr:DUF2705 family protein [Sporolactobacillus sp. THM19-2]RYL87313.1 DUF2705 domain-containing protein [Sporolactobacillus sp. THM19-2]
MRINERSFLFVLVLIIIQSLLSHRFDPLNAPFLFLEGVPVSMQSGIMYQLLIYWYIPIVGMSFYFCGKVHETLVSYGQLKIIRNFSKSRWMLGFYGRLYLFVLIFVLIQVCCTWISNQGWATDLARPVILQQLILYILALIVLFSMQMFLELFVNGQVAQLITNLYIILTILLTYFNYSFHGWSVLNYLGIPNYGMGLRTNLTTLNTFGEALVPSEIGMIILIFIESCILYFSIRRIKVMDII